MLTINYVRMVIKTIQHMKYTLGILLLFISAFSTAQNQENREDNVVYSTSTDRNYVYVHLSTDIESTMMSMLHQGFSVYFDTKGKKKKKVAIKYPSEVKQHERPERQNGRSQQANQNRSGRQKIQGQDEGTRERRGPDIFKIVNNLPQEAEYTFFDKTQEFNLEINALDIAITYTYEKDNGGILHYELKVPKYRITKDNVDLSKLSIGIVTTKAKQENRDSSNLSFGGRGQGGGPSGRSGGQGGPPSGGGQGGGRGGSGGGPPQQNQRPQLDTINFWFKANLH